MLLAIDAGNTNVVFALFEARTLKARWRIATDPRRTADEYAVWLMQLLAIEGVERQAVTRIIISTVVPRALHNLQVLASKYFGAEALIAGLPRVLAPWFFGWVATTHSTSFAFGLCAVAMAVALGFILLLQMVQKRAAAPLPTKAL